MAAQHFLVPIDFSEYANQALEYAIGLARKLAARVTLLHVIQSLPLESVEMSVRLPFTYLEALEAEITSSMQACLERVTGAGLAGEMVVVHGVPFQEILETARLQQV